MPRSALFRLVSSLISAAALALAASAGLGSLGRPAEAASPVDERSLDQTKYIPVSEIQPGMVATCRTVFQGRTIETFEMDVVGVLAGGRTDGDMILARARGERLKHDGIAAGMSGSPVYIDGRLAGALSFGWAFSRDPLCGITPIAEMLDVLDHEPGAPAGDFGAGGPVASARSTGASAGADADAATDADAGANAGAESPRLNDAGLARLRTPLVVSGLTPEARNVLAPWAEERGFLLAPGGSYRAAGSGPATGGSVPRLGADAARQALEPGAAIAVDLVRGDMNASAIGTLTWREGDRLVAFGHPFFQSGEVKMPLSLADITTVVASDLNSFKMGVAGEQVGAITQDRRAGIGGGIGEPPAMLPVTVRLVRGPSAAASADAPAETYRFQVLRHRTLASQLVGVLALNAVTARGGLLPEATWRYRFALAMPGRAPLELSDVGSGTLGTMVGSLTQPLQLLLNNPFAPLDAESLAVELAVEPELARAQIWSARLEPKVVRPGESVRVWIETRDWRGGSRETALDLDVPSDQPEGRLVVMAAGGPDLDKSESARLPSRHRASSLDELVERLGDRRKASQVYAALYGPGVELNLGGETYPDLPGFAQQLLASDREVRPSAPWGRLDRVAESTRPLDEPVAGAVSLVLEVKNRPKDRTPARGGDRAVPLIRGVEVNSEEDTE
jgi:hypothetical protein